MRIKSIGIVLLLMSGFLSNICYSENLPPLTHKLTKLKAKLLAPQLRLMDIDEEWLDLNDLKGKTIIVNFWATWCPPCRREMGSLERLNLAVKDKNVAIITVNVGEDIDTVFSFMASIDPFPSFYMLFDPEASSLQAWKVRGLPTTYIIDPKGTMAYRAVGGREFDHKEIQDIVLNLSKVE